MSANRERHDAPTARADGATVAGAAVEETAPAWWRGPTEEYDRLYRKRAKIYARENGSTVMARTAGGAMAAGAAGIAAAGIDIWTMPPRLRTWWLLWLFVIVGLTGTMAMGRSLGNRSRTSREYAALWNELTLAVGRGHVDAAAEEPADDETDPIRQLLQEDAATALRYAAPNGAMQPHRTVSSEQDFRQDRSEDWMTEDRT